MEDRDMSKIEATQKTVLELFSGKAADFLIPDYQRPYAWREEECRTLWEDITAFAFPDDDDSKFNDDEYYLGAIVTYRNEDGSMEVIDGQQRLTTLMLLLRAFYEDFGDMQDEESLYTKRDIAKCLWKTNGSGIPNSKQTKLASAVATGKDREELLGILTDSGFNDGMTSEYAKNYGFFQKQIGTFKSKYSDYFRNLVRRIMENCIILSVEAGDQDSALRIFSTLNDRGMPLADADIFKAKFYRHYTEAGKLEDFKKDWQNLEERCGKMLKAKSGNPMDELFTRYMYFVRAKQGITRATMKGLRAFYEESIKNEKYPIAFDKELFDNLKLLAEFWSDVEEPNDKRFTPRVLRRLYVLRSAPNSMWANIVSVYFMQNKDVAEMLDGEPFCRFLEKITAFTWAYSLMGHTVGEFRAPVFAEMANIVNGRAVEFSEYQFDAEEVRAQFEQTEFSNQRPITRSMLTWWAFRDEEKPTAVPSLDKKFDIEHIVAQRLQEEHHVLSDGKNLESLGNKSLLEKAINIRAADFRFSDKRTCYKEGTKRSNGGTIIQELLTLAGKDDFTEADIIARKEQMLNAFIDFLKENNLIG